MYSTWIGFQFEKCILFSEFVKNKLIVRGDVNPKVRKGGAMRLYQH